MEIVGLEYLRFDFPRLEQDLTVALRRQRASEEGSMELVEGWSANFTYGSFAAMLVKITPWLLNLSLEGGMMQKGSWCTDYNDVRKKSTATQESGRRSSCFTF